MSLLAWIHVWNAVGLHHLVHVFTRGGTFSSTLPISSLPVSEKNATSPRTFALPNSFSLMLFIAFLIPAVRAIPVSLPPGTVVCSSASWQDMITFFLVNYITHAVTVRIPPGTKKMESAILMATSLLLPFRGTAQARDHIQRGRWLSSTDLQKAARAGALFVVARSAEKHWCPEKGEQISGCEIQGEKPLGSSNRALASIGIQEYGPFQRGFIPDPPGKIISQDKVEIHGICSLPAGYELMRIHWQVLVEPDPGEPAFLDSSQNSAKSLASVVQLIYASITVYSSSGSQLDRYGYAAFGLTVVPYACMSLMNLVAGMMTPDYSHVYIVRSEVLDEARARGGQFRGTVGRLTVGPSAEPQTVCFDGVDEESKKVFYKDPGTFTYGGQGPTTIIIPPVGRFVVGDRGMEYWPSQVLSLLLTSIALLGPYIVIAALTKFNPQSSTVSQRGWILSWLVIGPVGGHFLSCLDVITNPTCSTLARFKPLWWALFSVPAIGGLVTVGIMIREFGTCVQV